MSAQALATVMGPPLMLHSANNPSGSEVDHAQPIAVLKYLLQIWPQPQTATISGNVSNVINYMLFVFILLNSSNFLGENHKVHVFSNLMNYN